MRLFLLFPILVLAPWEDKAQRRYEFETLYVIHHNVTAKKFKRIEALFAKVYPDFDMAKLKPEPKSLEEYYAIYRNRLLGKAAPGTDPKLIDFEKGYKLVRDQVDRELRVRAMFDHLLAEARRKGSVRAVFDRLVRKDDSKRPTCATEPGKALVVYRHVTATARELEDLTDSGVRFGRSFRVRVQLVLADAQAPPAFGKRPFVFGPDGHGRHIFRLLKVHRDPAPREGKGPGKSHR